MITSRPLLTKMPLKMDPQESHAGLNTLFAAAVVSQGFRDALLKDPEAAIRQGYLGKGFELSQADASLVVSLKAKSLADLAKKVVQTLGQ
jgi:hypothetical protein